MRDAITNVWIFGTQVGDIFGRTPIHLPNVICIRQQELIDNLAVGRRLGEVTFEDGMSLPYDIYLEDYDCYLTVS